MLSRITKLCYSSLVVTQPINHYSSTPHGTHILRLLNLCRRVVEDLKPLKSLLLVHGLIDHQPLIVEFFRRCFDLGSPELVLSAFAVIEKPSVFLQNSTVRSLCNVGLFEDALSVYQKCRISGCPSDNFTFPFVIKACSALGALQIGKGLHCSVLRNGFGDNHVVQTALVDLYAKCDQMGSARRLLDRISQPDLVPWNALISGYSLNGLNEEVFHVFQEICAMGFKPNVSTLASTIPVCTRLGYLHMGKSLHGFAVKLGYFLDEYLIAALILMYAGGGDFDVGRKLFDCLLEKNVTIWNAMISAYTQNQKPNEAFALFKQMLQANVQPNMITFLSIIPSCECFGCILYGESLHTCAVKYGLVDQLPVMTAILSIYAKLGDMGSAEFLFNQMPVQNLLSWNSLVSAYVHNRHWDVSLDAFREMQLAGFNPDAVSIVCVLSACSELEAILPGKSAHAYSLKNGFDFNLNVSNTLLAFYSNCYQLFSSFKLFRKMGVRNAISWNTLISGCVHNGEARNAVALLDQMQREGMDFDLVTLVSVLPCYCGPENLVQGMGIHGRAIKMGFASVVSLANALISMYFNCGEFHGGKLLFDSMLNKSMVSWNALITGYRYNNLHDDVMLLFCQMIKEDQKPNDVTLLNILPVCYTPLQGKSIHAYAARTGIAMGFNKDVAVVNALIDLYAKCGNISIARKLFDALLEKDVVSWSVMINGHGLHGDGEAALALVSQMELKGMKPDDITYVSILSACSHAGLVEQGRMFFNSMIENGIVPRMEHYACMVDLFGRTGHLNEAYDMVTKLPHKPSLSLLESLLGACIIHGNLQIGEEIGRLLLEMDPENPGSYVMLYNVYAAAGRWTDANKVRSDMEERQLRKVPGCSLVEGW